MAFSNELFLTPLLFKEIEYIHEPTNKEVAELYEKAITELGLKKRRITKLTREGRVLVQDGDHKVNFYDDNSFTIYDKAGQETLKEFKL